MKTFAVSLNAILGRADAEAFAAHGAGAASEQPKVLLELQSAGATPGDRVLLLFLRDDGRYDVLASCLLQSGPRLPWTSTSIHPSVSVESIAHKIRALTPEESASIDEEIARATHPLAAPDVPRAAALPATETVAPLPGTMHGDPAPQNIILYGPPGTGKTWATTGRALNLLRVKDIPQNAHAQRNVFRQFQEAGRIEFVTFHQSYGYEEFVEGLRPVLKNGQVDYAVLPGVLKQIAKRASESMVVSGYEFDPTIDFDTLWNRLKDDCAGGGVICQGKHEGKSYRLVPSTQGNFRAVPQHDPEGTPLHANGAHIRTLWEARDRLGATLDEITNSMIDQIVYASGQQPALRLVHLELLRLSRGVPSPTPQYVLIIDEINRGNISKILGELITLLEPDKRLGMPNALSLRLTYSPGEEFALPPNLHILGTMNTADRSIALIDVALRRRFTFERMPPRPDVIEAHPDIPEPLRAEMTALLETLNARLRYLLDEDHQIGHAYLLGVRSWADLRDVFRDRIIPLLYEYFHGAPRQVAAVLGCAVKEDGTLQRPSKTPTMLRAKRDTAASVFGFPDDDIDSDRVFFALDEGFLTGTDTTLSPYFAAVR